MTDALARRRAALAALGGEPFDVLVVGGGINGAGIARDAAMRGLRTALVERGDFASGTSSRSSKLIHGGLRYLEQGHVRLVLEAVRERERLRRLAPHLVRPQEFLFPVYRGGPVGPLMLAAGLWAYDLLAGFWNVQRHRMLGRRAVEAAEPTLRREGLCGAGQYWDCRTDDGRLVLETVLSAAGASAVVLSYAEVAGFLKEGGRVSGVRVVDRFGAGEVLAQAGVVVNAAGPWVDRVAALDAPAPPRLRLTKGVHLVVPRARIGHRAAVVLHARSDGRVMFVIPWGEHSLVGTTDTDHPGGPDVPPVAEPADVAYLLDTVNHYFPAARLGPDDVVSAFAGLRPLVAPRGGTAPRAGVVAATLSRDGRGLTPAVIDHLADRYGSRLGEVLERLAHDRQLAEPIVPGLPDPRAEVVQAVEREWALTLEDVLRRRTQVALRDAAGATQAATAVAALMARPLGWDAEATRAAAQAYVAAAGAGRRQWRE